MQEKFLSTFLSLILVLHVLNFSYSIKLPFKATIPHFETTSFSFSAIYEFNDSPFDMDLADPNVTLFNPEYLGDYVIKKMVVNGKEKKNLLIITILRKRVNIIIYLFFSIYQKVLH